MTTANPYDERSGNCRVRLAVCDRAERIYFGIRMSLGFLIALLLVHALEPPPLGDPAHIGLRCIAILLYVLAVVAMARWTSVWAVAGLQGDRLPRPQVLRRYYRATTVQEVLSLILFGFCVYVVGWPAVVKTAWRWQDVWIIEDLLLIGPYLFAEMLATGCYYAVDQAMRGTIGESGLPERPRLGFRTYLSFQFRGRFGVWFCTSLVMSGLHDLANWWIPDWTSRDVLAAGISLGMSLAVLTAAPLILRIVWLAKPLPAGPLRSELEALSSRLRFRTSDILIWNTGHGIANAAISGLTPQLRYVLLSDSLLEDLSADEIAAVFGHEVGHVRHRHMYLFFGFILLSTFATAALGQVGRLALQQWLAGSNWNRVEDVLRVTPLEFLLLIPVWIFGFGHLSRRCERQADLYGSRAASQTLELRPPRFSAFDAAVTAYQNGHTGSNGSNGIANGAGHPLTTLPPVTLELPPNPTRPGSRDPAVTAEGAQLFVRALEKVCLVNGMSLSKWGWRHGSIAQRIAFLERVAAKPAIADEFDRRMRRGLWTSSLATIAITIATIAVGSMWFPGAFEFF